MLKIMYYQKLILEEVGVRERPGKVWWEEGQEGNAVITF